MFLATLAPATMLLPDVLHDGVNVLMDPAGEVVPLPQKNGVRQQRVHVLLFRLVLLDNLRANHFHPGVQVMYLHGGDAVHIDADVSQQLHKIRVRYQLPQQSGIHPSFFQYVNHTVTQTQVRQISVWVTFHFRQPQQIVSSHTVEFRQLDKGVVADVLGIIRLIAAQRG